MIPARTRKLIGTIVFVTYLTVYALIAMAMGAIYFSESHGAWQFVFYALAGLAWLPGAMLIISWMAKADKA
jgi:hypothetical protein